jgi:D-3-phosphoglycerate dehydrogenase / 2-oxoglutarate reductase
MTYFIIDFDSTFVKLEALDELSNIVLQNHPQRAQIVKQIQAITQLGMEGKITFEESLSRRLSLFQPTKKHIIELIQLLQQHITNSVYMNRDFFLENADEIFIISGGFKEYIYPVVQEFGIAEDHILANTFLFDDKGLFVSYDTNNPLSKQDGKVTAVKSLSLQGNIIVIGDGHTDYQIKEAGLANTFYAFTENIRRDAIVRKADKELCTMMELFSKHGI